MNWTKCRLGNYIKLYDELNSLKEFQSIDDLQGINNEKYFQSCQSNKNDIDLYRYRICRKGMFAYNKATSRNGEKISIAYREGPDCLVSPSYICFYITDESLLSHEYLDLFFKRSVFDRYVRFHSWGSATEFFTFENMCDVEILLPPIKDQEKIVVFIKKIESRISFLKNENIISEQLCERVFESFISTFVKREKPIKEYGFVLTGKTPSTSNEMFYNSNDVPFVKTSDMHEGMFVCESSEYLSKLGADSQSNKYLPYRTVLMSCIGSAGEIAITTERCQTNQQINAIISKTPLFLYFCLKKYHDELIVLGDGSTTMLNINKNDFESFLLPSLSDDEATKIETKLMPIAKTIELNEKEMHKLNELKKKIINIYVRGD